ncbi:hypothetical protein FDP25_09580 [Roseovarius sp. A21]|uniref:Sulfotransferase domain-containing protein n=1 Tax=Roseovarius bejariae TaxID=2576383 RepID=A0A844CUG5_9RHOB|nr:hypothetical protein [Roseovarius bejariae]MRU15679.1 hypothetical protein [Roseovarius bejariae]
MNGKIILHIGYPKTATSSLQKNVLIPLHKKNRLNYLGEETKTHMGELHHDSKFVKNILLGGPDDLKFAFCVPSVELIHNRDNRIDPAFKLLQNKGLLQSFLQDSMVNILSYETLLMPYRSVVNWKSFSQRLYGALPTNSQVQIVVTLRNQPSLMESFFFEKSLGYYLKSSFTKPRQLYFQNEDGVGLRDSEQVNIFDFRTTLSEYEKVFGRENIHILFFEDIEKRPGDYFDAWASLLDIPASEISYLFTGGPRSRVSKADKDHFTLRVSVWDYLLKHSCSKVISPVSSGKNPGRPFALRLINAVRRLPFASRWMVNVRIPKFTASDKAAIYQHFKTSNAEVARMYNLDIAKMKAYGYL